MPDTTFPFEDLPLHRDGAFVSARVSGKAIISYDRHGNWQVERILIDADNNRLGPEARGQELQLDLRRHSALWKLVDDALSREANEDIVDRIVADQAYEDPNAEHHLDAVLFGVGTAMGAW